jgi:hypothetical protein
MEPWYKVATPRAEVREGRSFNPDEFAIALEQVVGHVAPPDYRYPKQFFDRTCFTRALSDHLGLVLRRVAGQTENTPADLSLITQFGGGKTHALTAIYHLFNSAKISAEHPDVKELLKKNGLSHITPAKVAVFVGNAWDPSEGRETPWLDIAWQLAGAAGVEALGPKARTTAPGTDRLTRLFDVAGGRVVLLFDEVLNFFNRHRDIGEGFYAFLDNVVRAMTGTRGSAAVVSLPRSQTEMTDYDQQWLDRINKCVHRVSKDLIANDESEIAEVVRRRLFEDLGKETTRRAVAKAYAEWCFERRAQLPPEWTAVDTTSTDAKAREFLRARFESAYPFHPATISVFQRKWQSLLHYQRTRGTLAMFAAWISWTARESFRKARREPLITLGSAPLDVPEFQATLIGQLGEQKLLPAIEVDIGGVASHAHALDADTKGSLRDIHRRVGAAVLFESTGIASDKAAHLPELRFALGEPELDITSIDNAADALEKRAFFIRKVGTDGYRIGPKATLKKVVADCRASLDDAEVEKTVRSAVRGEFEKGQKLGIQFFPASGTDVPDTPKLTLVVVEPGTEWEGAGDIRKKLGEWTIQRGGSNRLYPAAVVWLVRKPGRTLQEKAESSLAWRRVETHIASGLLGKEYERSELSEIATHIKDAADNLKDEVWASYRYAIIADPDGAEGVKEIDLGAGHASASSSLSERVVAALKAEGFLNETVGAGYIDRNWPVALKDSGAWPLKGLRKAFLDGSLTRLLDPEDVLRRQIVAFVEKGDFGLGSGLRADGSYERLWWKEGIGAEEVLFDDRTFLLTPAAVGSLKQAPIPPAVPDQPATAPPVAGAGPASEGFVLTGAETEPPKEPETLRLRLAGPIPWEQWNKVGQRLIPKLHAAGQDLTLTLDASLTVGSDDLAQLEADLRQALKDLGLDALVRIEKRRTSSV